MQAMLPECFSFSEFKYDQIKQMIKLMQAGLNTSY